MTPGAELVEWAMRELQSMPPSEQERITGALAGLMPEPAELPVRDNALTPQELRELGLEE